MKDNLIYRRPDESVCWCGKKYTAEDFKQQETDTIICSCGMMHTEPEKKK